MIEVKGLVKRFGSRYGLHGVDLFVEQGEFAVVLGPNGAGKTTLLRILAGLSRPTCGFVVIGGHRLPEGAVGIRRRLGVVTHQPMLYGDLTLVENLKFHGRMFEVDDLDGRIREVMDLVGLTTYRNELVRTLSKGLMQRLTIGRAILHRPDLMLLDEPHSSLDQEACRILDDVLLQASAQGHTILLATHDLERAANLGSIFHVLSNGGICSSTPGGVRIGLGGLVRFYQDALAGTKVNRDPDAGE